MHSIAKRYFVTLVVNIAKMGYGMVSVTIVPRGLGPLAYGDFSFIQRMSQPIFSFLSLGTSDAFFTYSSGRRSTGVAFYVYYIWLALQLVVVFLFALISNQLGSSLNLYSGQNIQSVYLIVLLVWLTILSASLTNFGESKAENVLVQKMNAISLFIQALLLIILFLSRRFSLTMYVLLSLVAPTFLVASIPLALRRKGYVGNISKDDLPDSLRYFFNYCHPLVVASIVTLIASVFARWFLQRISGSFGQAYFSIALQWSMVPVLISSAMVSILWREASFHFAEGSIADIRRLIVRFSKPIFFIVGSCSFFLALNSERLLVSFAGPSYRLATPVLIIASFYPIFYVVNQIMNTILYATGRVKILRNMTIIFSPVDVVITYFLLAPKNFSVPGLELGPAGLALEYVLSTAIMSALLIYYVARSVGMTFGGYLVELAETIGAVFIMGVIVELVFSLVSLPAVTALLVKAFSFAFLSAIIVYCRPPIIGLTANEVAKYKETMKNLFNRTKDLGA